jgi:hypothetical protein
MAQVPKDIMKRSVGISRYNGVQTNNVTDYNGLEHALKRVKISASPGQLRLENDLESLIEHHKWNKSRLDDSVCSQTYQNSKQFQSFRYFTSPTNLYHIERDTADPLRIYITLIFPKDQSHSSSTQPSHCAMHFEHDIPNQCAKLMFHVEIPRMYPHVPPIVNRIIKSMVGPNGEDLYRITSDASYSSSDIVQSQFCNRQGAYVQVTHRVQNPFITLWVSEELQKPSFARLIELEKTSMLTAFIISSNSVMEYAQPDHELMLGTGLEISQQECKGHNVLYHDRPYHNIAVFPNWSPIFQLSDFIEMLSDVSSEWERVRRMNMKNEVHG